MKKRNIQKKIDCIPVQNLVAKFAHQFNKAQVFDDKNRYHRNVKHRKQEVSLIMLFSVIRETSFSGSLFS
jgi:hypothetical protein